MVKKVIDTSNVKESNLFLRKLWSELDEIQQNGWQYYPDRNKQEISIGFCNLGQVKFNYKKKGCIHEIMIDTDDQKEKVEKAIERAKNFGCIHRFAVEVYFDLNENRMRKLGSMSTKTVYAFSNKEINGLQFNINAYSNTDLEYLLVKKTDTLSAILTVFTDQLFVNGKYKYMKNPITVEENLGEDYNFAWTDHDEVPTNIKGEILLPYECLKFIEKVVENDYYEDQLAFLVDACRQYYFACILYRDITGNGFYNRTGYVDIMNTMFVSVLEPLSVMKNPTVEVCPQCGNKKYSIVKKMRDLLCDYMDTEEAKLILDRSYQYRSKFLHEGKAMTSESYSGFCWPQIDPKSKNEMLSPSTQIEYALKDRVAYVIRNCVRTYFQERN